MAHTTVYLHTLHSYLTSLNLFVNSERITPHDLKNQRVTTRLFLVFFVVFLVILIIYTSISTITYTVIVKNPSISTYNALSAQYPETLVCPCHQFTIPYGNFLSYNPKYHQVCQSDFVSDKWMKYLKFQNEQLYYLDIRKIGYFSFQMLSSLCELSQQIVEQDLLTLNSTIFISLYTLPQNVFYSQIDASINLFKQTTINTFLILLTTNRNITQVNNIISALQTNEAIQLISNPSDDGYANILYYFFQYGNDNCSCGSSGQCKAEMGVYNDFNMTTAIPQFTIPNFYTGCYVLEALLQSDLSCFYNISCLNELQLYLPTNTSLTNFTSLNSSFKSQYNETTTINELVQELIIENWNIEVNYMAYFKSCEPSSCTYSFNSRNSILYIIITVFGLIGGITTVLYFLIPIVVAFIGRRKKQRTDNEPESVLDQTLTIRQSRLQILWLWIKRKLVTLNIFKDVQSSDEYHLGNQILATRLFIIILIISIFFFALYSSLIVITKTVTVTKPLLDQYFKLEQKYQSTLICSCSSISNEYKQFIFIQPKFHQICDSNLIQTNWVGDQVSAVLYSNNLNAIVTFSFFNQWLSILKSFCQLSTETIENQLLSFNSTRFVTQNLFTQNLLQTQANESILLFQLATQTSFNLSITMIRQTTQGNQLEGGLTPNGGFDPIRDNFSSQLVPYTNIFFLENDSGYCYCKYNLACKVGLHIQSCPENCQVDLSDLSITNLYFACYPNEAVLMSTLECFFTESCLENIVHFFRNTTNLTSDVTVLNSSTISRYSPNTTINQIVAQLLIEQWNTFVSYENYYRSCQPAKCTYTYRKQNDLTYIITMTIGFLGGLATILKFLLVPIVSFIRRPKLTFNRIRTSLKTLNFFIDVEKITEYDLQNQKMSTRLFILSQLISLFILVLYTSFSNLTETAIIHQPNSTSFTKLYEQYQETLVCPCSNISLNYEKFISFNPIYHQICQSDFIKSDWYKYFGYAEDIGISYYVNVGTSYIFRTMIDDYRQTGGVAFQYLSSLCQMTSQLAEEKLKTFNLTKFLSLNVVSPQLFETQTNNFIRSFKTETVNSFRRLHDLIRNLTQGNQLLSLWLTNGILTLDVPDDGNHENDSILTDDGVLLAANGRLSQMYPHRIYNLTCDCTQSQFCIQQAKIYDLNATTIVHPVGDFEYVYRTTPTKTLFVVPGLYVGCYIIEALLQSDLRCFYDQECLSLLLNAIDYPFNVTLLNASISTQYRSTSTINALIDNLFIEEWNNRTSYESYYTACQPQSCTYSYITRATVIYVISTTISLIGGLTKVYRLLVPLAVRLVRQFILLFRQRFQRRNTVADMYGN